MPIPILKTRKTDAGKDEQQMNVGLALTTPIPVAARSKAWVYSRSLAGIVGSNPAGGMDACLL
jgi:hypothetical protein